MNHTDDTYHATIRFVRLPRTIQCVCSGCDWAGTADVLAPIGEADLTPGDPSPAGRCPECDSLAYVETTGAPTP